MWRGILTFKSHETGLLGFLFRLRMGNAFSNPSPGPHGMLGARVHRALRWPIHPSIETLPTTARKGTCMHTAAASRTLPLVIKLCDNLTAQLHEPLDISVS
jgi:hypothetical protein